MEGARRQSGHLRIAMRMQERRMEKLEKKEGDEKEKGKTIPSRFMKDSSRRTLHGAGLYSVVYLPFANQTLGALRGASPPFI
uniref:Uncharacterized protein n=1 Tax=Oryza punctata TaxID=4537 RepID=A0A0E0JK08_ORYPU